MWAKDNLSLLFPRFSCVNYYGIFLEISEHFWMLLFFFFVFNLMMDSSSPGGRPFPVSLWREILRDFLLIFLELFFNLFFSGLFFSHWHELFVFSCSSSPQGVLWPNHLSFCIFIFLCFSSCGIFASLHTLFMFLPCQISPSYFVLFHLFLIYHLCLLSNLFQHF